MGHRLSTECIAMTDNNEHSKTKLLIVEDDLHIAKLLERFLVSEGFHVEHCDNGYDAAEQIKKTMPEVVILDMLLPGKDGIEICREVRPFYQKGILMLTAQDDDLNETMALNSGIDDYLTKPVRPHVLLAHINALLRRLNAEPPKTTVQVQDLVISKDNRTVLRGESAVALSDSEFELLWLLALQAGETVKRDDLFLMLRGKPYDGIDRSIDMRVSVLRKALQKNNPENEYIKTLRHKGYILLK